MKKNNHFGGPPLFLEPPICSAMMCCCGSLCMYVCSLNFVMSSVACLNMFFDACCLSIHLLYPSIHLSSIYSSYLYIFSSVLLCMSIYHLSILYLSVHLSSSIRLPIFHHLSSSIHLSSCSSIVPLLSTYWAMRILSYLLAPLQFLLLTQDILLIRICLSMQLWPMACLSYFIKPEIWRSL